MIPLKVLAWAIMFVEAHTNDAPAAILPQIEYHELSCGGGQRIAGLIDANGVTASDPQWNDSIPGGTALVHEIVHWEQWRAGKFAATAALPARTGSVPGRTRIFRVSGSAAAIFERRGGRDPLLGGALFAAACCEGVSQKRGPAAVSGRFIGMAITALQIAIGSPDGYSGARNRRSKLGFF